MTLENGLLMPEGESDYMYIETEKGGLSEIEFTCCNLKDFVNDLIYAGLKNFKIGLGRCNWGIMNVIAEVSNGEIIHIEA